MQSQLANVRVIEIGNVAAGPYCGMLLADLGADVIKVENPDGGDTLRHWPPLSDGYSENFASLNRNKRSVTLDLKTDHGKAALRDLVKGAQVLIENNRPGVMGRLGLAYEVLRAVNPALVYCSISAYGQTGPRAGEGGFDLTIQAMSGVMSVTGEQDGPPVKCGVPLVDFSAGLYGALSIVAALRNAEATGIGTHIDVPMLGTTLALAALQTSEYFGSGKDPVRLGSAHPRNAPYQAFDSRDGYFGMAAGTDSLWRAVCRVVGRLDLADDPQFIDTSSRARNQRELTMILQEIFRREDSAAWLERFRAAGVPCAPLNTFSEVLRDEQVTHMGWVQPLELPNGVMTRTFLSPVQFGGRKPAVDRRPPGLGEHNSEILGVPATDAVATPGK